MTEQLLAIMESSRSPKVTEKIQEDIAEIIWSSVLPKVQSLGASEEDIIWYRNVLTKVGKYTIIQSMNDRILRFKKVGRFQINDYNYNGYHGYIDVLFSRLEAAPVEEARRIIDEALPGDEEYLRFLFSLLATIVDHPHMREVFNNERTRRLSINLKKIEVESYRKLIGQVDSAMMNKGGIDFDSNKMSLNIQNGGNEIKFHLDPAMLEKLRNAPGFVPVIINIQPLKSIPQFLGVADNVKTDLNQKGLG